jgi:hypothetical protein
MNGKCVPPREMYAMLLCDRLTYGPWAGIGVKLHLLENEPVFFVGRRG